MDAVAQARRPTEQRRAQITVAALRLLADGGPQRLTAKHLGEAVGIDGSTVFRHFADMTAVVQAAIDEFEAALQASFPDLAPGLEGLEAFVRHRYGLVSKRPELVRLAFGAHALAAAGEEAQARRVHAIVRRSMRFITLCLDEAKAQGRLRNPAATQTLTWALAGVMRGAVMAPRAQRLSPDQLWEQLGAVLGVVPDLKGEPR